MGERALTLNDQIIQILEMAIKPLSAADIRRRMEGDVQPDEVGSRLSKLRKRGVVLSTMIPSQASTGPRMIKGWVDPDNEIAMEHVPDIAKPPENGPNASREVASATRSLPDRAA